MDVVEIGLDFLYWILVILGWLTAVTVPLMLINKVYPITEKDAQIHANVAFAIVIYFVAYLIATAIFVFTKQSWITSYLALIGIVECCVSEILDFAAKLRIRKLAQNILHGMTTLIASGTLGIIIFMLVTFGI